MTRTTTWTVEHDALIGRVRIVLETSDPAIVAAVEAAAHRHGVQLARTVDEVSEAATSGEGDEP